MIENIVIREAVTEEERSLFWERLRAYFCRDIFPDPEDEDRPYFLGDDYRRTMESLRTRPVHPVHWLVFSRNGQDVGFALAAVFTGEDGKCFILEFCVLPEQRGGGMGTACARTLLNWAREQGAGYAELNCTTPPRQRFWGRLGFVANGAGEWGVPLMLLPPREHGLVTGCAAYRQAGDAPLPAQSLGGLHQLPGHAPAAEYRLHIEILQLTNRSAGKGGEYLRHRAHAHSPAISPGHQEGDSPLPDGLGQPLLLLLRGR